jgi:hypothetical protein
LRRKPESAAPLAPGSSGAREASFSRPGPEAGRGGAPRATGAQGRPAGAGDGFGAAMPAACRARATRAALRSPRSSIHGSRKKGSGRPHSPGPAGASGTASAGPAFSVGAPPRNQGTGTGIGGMPSSGSRSRCRVTAGGASPPNCVARGWPVNHKRLQRRRREDHLLGWRRRQFRVTTDSSPPPPLSPPVAAERELPGLHPLWVADLTDLRGSRHSCTGR